MYICESRTIKKAEHRRIDDFELWCWRRLLRFAWTAWRANQSILKEISPECALEELILKLKLQYFGHLMRRTDSFEKTLMLGKIEGRRRRGQQRIKWCYHQLNGHGFEPALGVGEGQGSLAYCSPQGHKELDTTEQLNWVSLLNKDGFFSFFTICIPFIPFSHLIALAMHFSTVNRNGEEHLCSVPKLRGKIIVCHH